MIKIKNQLISRDLKVSPGDELMHFFGCLRCFCEMAANITQFRLVNDKAATFLPFGWSEKENRQVESPGIGILNLTEKFT